MNNNAFELGEEIQVRLVEYRLHPDMWLKYDLTKINLKFNNWKTIKYLNNDGTDFNNEIENIPNNKGGLYMFSIGCPIIPGFTEYPVYIGRAQYTGGQNLRKRCKEYFQKYSRQDERPKITRIFKYSAKELFLSVLTIEDFMNDTKDLEIKLINSLLLPFNDEIPEKDLKQAVKAFKL